ncbi:MAG: aldo/keto reductase [Planctomycetes bacterium]|nr:aldo/keto reductase [Planctomycetota bacterium]
MIPTVPLGAAGIQVSELCFGTGTSGWGGHSDQTRLGKNALIDLLVYGHSLGICFWDSADQYGSHPHVREALRQVGRERVVLTTKTCAATRQEAEKDIARFLRETGTDYLDIVLMHCMTSSGWADERSGVLDALESAKQKGWVRAHGVSCHHFGAFQKAAQNPWVDVVLARINHSGVHMDASVPEIIRVLQSMHARGIGIYGMKVVGAGQLTSDAARAIHFVRELDCVDAIVLGMSSRKQIDENVEFFKQPAGAPSPA